jgi:O-antigen/teichoic acid export membrane protein
MASDLIIRAGKAAVWVAVAKWFDLIGALVALAVTARLLPPEAFGIYGMALLATLVPETVISGALGEGIIQRKDLRPGHLNGVFWVHIALFAAFMAGLWVVTPLAVAQFSEPQLALIVPIMAGSLLFGCVGVVPGALLRRDLRFGVIGVADAISTITAAVSAIGLALLGWGVWALVWSEVLRRFAKNVALLVAARWAPSFAVTRTDVSELMRFNVLTLVTGAIQQLETAIPKYFVGLLLGAQALGYFNMASRFYQQLTQVLLAPFSAVALPVAAAVQHDRPQLHAAFAAGTRASTMLAFPVFVGAAAIAPVAIPLVFGAAWIPAVAAAQVLVLSALRAPVNAFNGELLRGTGKPGIYVALMTFGTLLVLFMAPFATPHGLAWVAATVLIRGFAQWVASAIIIERELGYPAIKQFTIGWESLVASVGMGIAVTVALPFLEILPRSASFFLLVSLGIVLHMSLLALLAPKLARRLVRLCSALLRRDRNGVKLILSASS